MCLKELAVAAFMVKGTKTVKNRLFKKYLKRIKVHQRFCSGLGNVHFSEKKTIEKHKSVGTGACKVGKLVRFSSNINEVIRE